MAFRVHKSRSVALTDLECSILDFERNWWAEPGPKETAIVEKFELTTTQYYQQLNELIDSPEAGDYDPLVVRRLQRLRNRRRQTRYTAVAERPAT